MKEVTAYIISLKGLVDEAEDFWSEIMDDQRLKNLKFCHLSSVLRGIGMLRQHVQGPSASPLLPLQLLQQLCAPRLASESFHRVDEVRL